MSYERFAALDGVDVLLFTFFSTLNQGNNMAYRVWPTNFSEFDWNRDALRKIGALSTNYHTLEMWFSQP
jgi:hypothetical protein